MVLLNKLHEVQEKTFSLVHTSHKVSRPPVHPPGSSAAHHSGPHRRPHRNCLDYIDAEVLSPLGRSLLMTR
ncbi:hypothetical protein Asera_60410 [Actinocatenispora sera]|uniref:Uncharacterized protein n=1 Tax=Actinocatenispora sera TaxID=390989 RepID=A0A810L9H9_9ACTN|nr:hypothetical protein Asera_60410 [Actinocatenispora sera]